MSHCFPNVTTIGLLGDTQGMLSAWLFFEKSNQTYLLLDVLNETTINGDPSPSVHDVDIYIVAVSSANDLEKALGKLWTTNWWQPNKYFLISYLKYYPKNGNCWFSEIFLEITYLHDVLNAVFICTLPKGDNLLITSNTYSRSYSKNWLKLRLRIFNEYSVQLFFRRYNSSGKYILMIKQPQTY